MQGDMRKINSVQIALILRGNILCVPSPLLEKALDKNAFASYTFLYWIGIIGYALRMITITENPSAKVPVCASRG